MFTWISGIQYFEMFPQYYALILTLRKSAPRVLAFLMGVMPVFLGFAYFGVAYFSTGSALFSNVDQSAVALFALLNGDVIHDVFDNIYPISPVLSRIYLYTFISLFIYAVLNIFIAIVEDAFFAAKQETEKEIDEDIQQRKFDIHDLDVVGLVAGPPVPIPGSTMNLFDDNGSVRGGSDGLVAASKKLSLNHHTLQFKGADNRLSLGRQNSANANSGSDDDYDDMKTGREYSHTGNELTAPLISRLRHSELSRSERILIAADDDPKIREIQRRHTEFLKIVQQLMGDYNKKFLNEIKQILQSIQTELRPPHSFDNFPCGFSDCIYCHLKTLLQSNLQTLRNNVAHSIENAVNSQQKGKGSTNLFVGYQNVNPSNPSVIASSIDEENDSQSNDD